MGTHSERKKRNKNGMPNNLGSRMRRNSRISVANVNEECMLCCCCVAEFRLVQFDSCDQQAISVGLFNAEEFALHELLECKLVGLSS